MRLLACCLFALGLAVSPPPPPPFDVPGGVTVIVNGTLYTPSLIKNKSVFFSGDRVLKFVDAGAPTQALVQAFKAANVTVKLVDAAGGSIIPGLIDPHVHANGGGGELGYASRTPEAVLSELIKAGLTSIVGLLGTDTVTRGQKDLLAKLKALGQDLNVHMWIGGYREPGPTLTGSVQSDILLVEEVIGVGELAISDHRSSWPSTQQLLQTVSDARVAGLLAGKAGVVQFHVGTAPTLLQPLWAIVNQTTIPITNLLPTHVTSRGPALIADALRWNKAGGFCDFTADDDQETDTLTTLLEWNRGGANLSRVTLSSDAYGSLPVFDSKGELIGYGVGSPLVVLDTIRNLIINHSWPVDQAIQFNTVNVATVLGLPTAGRLAEGGPADLVILNKTSYVVDYSFARGQVLKTPIWVKRGMFEAAPTQGQKFFGLRAAEL